MNLENIVFAVLYSINGLACGFWIWVNVNYSLQKVKRWIKFQRTMTNHLLDEKENTAASIPLVGHTKN
jgi:uncharacterized membrane protein YciS (DUF1049 family)